MKIQEKIGMMMVASYLLATTSCTDFSDYNTIDASAEPSADKTLWENISANANLSDFASVLRKVGYDKVLNESHTYTVWAPVNGSFNKDSLFSLSDEKITKEFVNNMIADYSHLETDVNDTTIYMLNEKLQKFTGKNTSSMSFAGIELIPNSKLQKYNCPSTNGLLYTITNPSAFRYNAYEIISEQKDEASKFHDLVMRFHTETLDESRSVPGKIVDGVQQYDDSVMIVSNQMMTQMLRAQVSNEDSLYTIFIPNDEAWEEASARIAPYYNYLSEMVYQDLSHKDLVGVKGGGTTAAACFMKAGLGQMTSKLASKPADSELPSDAAYMQDSVTWRLMTQDLVYSETNKHYNSKLSSGARFEEGDTLYSTTRHKRTNLPELDEATVSRIQLSNGHARVINKIPFKSWETYAPEIRTRSVGRYITATGNSFSTVRVENLPDTLCTFDYPTETELRYVRINVPDGNSAAPEMDFPLHGVLSTTYDIYAVVVPGWLEHMGDEEYVRKPYTLRFDINYTNEKNEEVRARFNGEEAITTATVATKIAPFLCGDQKIDTLKLGRVTFPVCYAGTDAYPNIKVLCTLSSFGSANRKKYDQQIRIANIILKPIDLVEYEEKLKATKKED